MTIEKRILRKEHIEAGLSFHEDEDTAWIMRNGEKVAIFAASVTIAEILEAADKEIGGFLLDDSETDPDKLFGEVE